MTMLIEVGNMLKIFVTETCDLLIEKLGIFRSELASQQTKAKKDFAIMSEQFDGIRDHSLATLNPADIEADQ